MQYARLCRISIVISGKGEAFVNRPSKFQYTLTCKCFALSTPDAARGMVETSFVYHPDDSLKTYPFGQVVKQEKSCYTGYKFRT